MIGILKDISINIIYLPCLLGLAGFLVKKERYSLIPLLILLLFYLLVERNSYNFAAQSIDRRTIGLLPYFLAVEVSLVFLLYRQFVSFWVSAVALFVLLTVIIEATMMNSETMLVSKTLEPIGVSVICVSWLMSTFKIKERKIERLPMFWVTSGFMLYFIPLIFLFPIEYGFLQIEWADQLFTIQVRWVVNIISKIIISVGLWMELRS